MYIKPYSPGCQVNSHGQQKTPNDVWSWPSYKVHFYKIKEFIGIYFYKNYVFSNNRQENYSVYDADQEISILRSVGNARIVVNLVRVGIFRISWSASFHLPGVLLLFLCNKIQDTKIFIINFGVNIQVVWYRACKYHLDLSQSLHISDQLLKGRSFSPRSKLPHQEQTWNSSMYRWCHKNRNGGTPCDTYAFNECHKQARPP